MQVYKSEATTEICKVLYYMMDYAANRNVERECTVSLPLCSVKMLQSLLSSSKQLQIALAAILITLIP